MTLIERQLIGDRLRLYVIGGVGMPGMTIAQAAKESGVSSTTITGIVRGKVPSTITAMRLAKLWSGR